MADNRYDQSFKERLSQFDFETLEKSVDTIYALDSKLNFIYFNPQYVTFASENGFEGDILTKFPIGSSIQAILEEDALREVYLTNYLKSLEDSKPWSFEYQCSSAAIYRNFYHRTYPVSGGDCMIIINSLAVERPIGEVHARQLDPSDQIYLQPDRYVHQCSNCRRTKRTTSPDHWDWVPGYIDRFHDQVSHTLCPLCFEYYWKYSSGSTSA